MSDSASYSPEIEGWVHVFLVQKQEPIVIHTRNVVGAVGGSNNKIKQGDPVFTIYGADDMPHVFRKEEVQALVGIRKQ